MRYKGFKDVWGIFVISPKKVWGSFSESYKQSKITFFFQVVNFGLVLYLALFVVPNGIADIGKLNALLGGNPTYYAIGLIFFAFIFWVIGGIKALGYGLLFETDRNLTLCITGACLSVVFVEKLYYKEIKDFAKRLVGYEN